MGCKKSDKKVVSRIIWKDFKTGSNFDLVFYLVLFRQHAPMF